MCEANAYWSANGKEDLILESVDVVEPQPDGRLFAGEYLRPAENTQGEAEADEPGES